MGRPLWAVLHLSYSIGLHGGQEQAELINSSNNAFHLPLEIAIMKIIITTNNVATDVAMTS